MINLLGSNDPERLLTRDAGDLAATKLSYALLVGAEGAPMIYYGDEVGLVGENDPGCRGAMPWDEARWNADLLEYLRELIRLRTEHEPLRRGAQRVRAHNDDLVAIERTGPAGDRVVTLVNRGSQPQTCHYDQMTVLFGEGNFVDATLTVAPNAIVVVAGGGAGT